MQLAKDLVATKYIFSPSNNSFDCGQSELVWLISAAFVRPHTALQGMIGCSKALFTLCVCVLFLYQIRVKQKFHHVKSTLSLMDASREFNMSNKATDRQTTRSSAVQLCQNVCVERCI